MFDKLKKYIKEATRVEPFDASKFNDPLALEVEWIPAKSGGSSFKTHKLISDDFNRAEFKPTVGSRLFSGVFILAGIGAMVAFGAGFLNESGTVSYTDIILPVLFGLVFVGVGVLLMSMYTKPIVFDKMSGFYWKGWKTPDHNTNTDMKKNCCRISDIYAIQLLSEYVRGDKSSYYSYEMNLILKDGNRLNVIDHGKRESIREDANTLSSFLGKPIWDAI